MLHIQIPLFLLCGSQNSNKKRRHRTFPLFMAAKPFSRHINFIVNTSYPSVNKEIGSEVRLGFHFIHSKVLFRYCLPEHSNGSRFMHSLVSAVPAMVSSHET